MDQYKVFISYTHADEWLKDEFISHLSALKRNGIISVWHDRLIPAGKILDSNIDENLYQCDIFVMLVSSDFINSEYCYAKEYKTIVERHSRNEVEIIPVIVRECDWDVGGLKKLNALPRDAIAVTKGGLGKDETHSRDSAWVDVINGIKFAIEDLKKKLDPPRLKTDYLNKLFQTDGARHPVMKVFDENAIWIDPTVYNEKDRVTITRFNDILELFVDNRSVVIHGQDRSGKSLLSKKLQQSMTEKGYPTVLINGKDIRTVEIIVHLRQTLTQQLERSNFPLSRIAVVIDDFDECRLNDTLKERVVTDVCKIFGKLALISFSNSPSFLFALPGLPPALCIRIEKLDDKKLFELTRRWRSIGSECNELEIDKLTLETFDKLLIVFNQTEIDKLFQTAITLLEMIDSTSGTDLSFSSFAACYDAMISARLTAASVPWTLVEEAKNFLSLLAYTAYVKQETRPMSLADVEECIQLFHVQFFSDRSNLRRIAAQFLRKTGDEFSFLEEYIWYFLCARYAVRTLQVNDRKKFNAFVAECCSNIFLKRYANIVIYIAYFANDNQVLESLLVILDELFSKADDWTLSDDARGIMLNIHLNDELLISDTTALKEQRESLIGEKINDLVDDAERIVAKYTLPFLSHSIGDSAYID